MQANPSHVAKKARYFYRIAVLLFLCYDEHKNEAEGLPALLDNDWHAIGQIGIWEGKLAAEELRMIWKKERFPFK